MKRFERHVKRDVAVVNVRRFVLLVDNWTQTGARPPMIDHATQTGFPALLDAETQTGEYTVQDVEVHARTATKPIARRKEVFQIEHTVWCSKCTQTDSVILEDKGVPDAESVPMTLFSLDINADDEHIKYYTGLPSYAAFHNLCDILTPVFLAEKKNACSLMTPNRQLLMVLMKL